MLFSVLDAGGQIAGQAVSPQGSTVFRTPGDSTSQILQDTQNIRPIVRVNQGTELAITVAKDFDFSQVYGLGRSEEHTSELQSLMRISYAVFCLKKKKTEKHTKYDDQQAGQSTLNNHNLKYMNNKLSKI